METDNTQSPPQWTVHNAKELRQLTKYLKRVNEVAGVFDPSGGVVEAEKRERYLQLAAQLSRAMGGAGCEWANTVAWDTPKQEHAHVRSN